MIEGLITGIIIFAFVSLLRFVSMIGRTAYTVWLITTLLVFSVVWLYTRDDPMFSVAMWVMSMLPFAWWRLRSAGRSAWWLVLLAFSTPLNFIGFVWLCTLPERVKKETQGIDSSNAGSQEASSGNKKSQGDEIEFPMATDDYDTKSESEPNIIVLQRDEQFGPYSVSEVLKMWDHGMLAGNSLYWRHGMDEWQPLAPAIEDLRHHI